MRCANCGEPNEPGSRFCGSCGAKLEIAERPRVAPTARISDFSPPAAVIADPVPTPSPTRSYIDNPGYAEGGPSAGAHSGIDESSQSIAIPRRRVPIAIILVVDVALAIAGAVMLANGLSTPEVSAVPGSAAPMPARVPSTPLDAALLAADKDAATGSDMPPPDAAPQPAPRPPPRRAPTPKPIRNSSAVQGPRRPTLPVDPPNAPARDAADLAPNQPDPLRALSSEVELATARTRSEFDGCHAAAGGTRAVSGSITIAFRVIGDGRVANVAAVENTTRIPELAACLIAAIERWRFAARPQAPADFSRTFVYR